MSGQGQQIFIDVLARPAACTDDPQVASYCAALTAPLRIAVRGRRGVGVPTVVAALTAAGYRVVAADAELVVYVLAEVCKPEDRAVLRTEPPDLLLLNKADLAGWGAGGPLPRAHRQAAELTAATGVPTTAFVAPLALAAVAPGRLDDELVAALRLLVAEPADLTSPDAFVAGGHRLPGALRRRLIDTLDLFGIAHAVVTLRESPGCDVGELRRSLGSVSGIDEVRAGIFRAGAQPGYRRIVAVCAALQARAITDDTVAHWLTADRTVLARMSAAVDVLEATGCRVDPADSPGAHLDRALLWRDYARAPLSEVHRSCGADVVRGSLRLLHAGASR